MEEALERALAAARYRRAAGHLEPAARAALGPDGLEALPPVTVRDLAAALGLADPAEVAERLRAGEDDVIRHLRRRP